MNHWTRILCAIDGSEPSREALAHAVELARRERAALHVVHVQRRMTAVPALGAPPPPPLRADHLDRGALERRPTDLPLPMP